MRKENRICILLPTYRNVDCVSYFLDCTLKSCRENNIDVCIVDSSTDDAIEKYIDSIAEAEKRIENDSSSAEHFKKTTCNVRYMKWNESKEKHNANTLYEEFSNPDLKVFESMKIIKEDYDYIWLTGDNCVLNIDDLIEDIKRYTANNYDIIHFSNGKEMEFGKEIEYKDAISFYANDVWHVTAYGATIINTKLIDYICNPLILDKYLGSGFLYVMSLFEYCSCHPFRAIHSQRNFHKNNIYRRESGWILSGDALGVFGRNWVEANMQLPSLYDSLKPQAIKSFAKNTGLFGYKKCVKLRSYNCISLTKIIKYKRYIRNITDTSIIWLYFISFIPKPFIKQICKSVEGKK